MMFSGTGSLKSKKCSAVTHLPKLLFAKSHQHLDQHTACSTLHCALPTCRAMLGESGCATRASMASIPRLTGPVGQVWQVWQVWHVYGKYGKYVKSEWWATHATYALCDEAPPHMPSQAA